MSKYTIVHGELRKVDDSTLMHWKYIKRERVNGTWRYYYNEPKKDGQSKSYNKLQDAVGLDEYDRAAKATADYEAAKDKYDNYGARDAETHEKLTSDRARTHVEAMKAHEEFMKTPLAKVSLAKDAVGKLLKKIGSKLRSKKR